MGRLRIGGVTKLCLIRTTLVHQNRFNPAFNPAFMRKTYSAPAGQRSFRSLRVLVADDSRVERKVVASILERRGHRVTVAADGREALTLFHQHAFDAAVLDLQMPGLDGEALATLLRERLRNLEGPDQNSRTNPEGHADQLVQPFRIIAVSGTLPEEESQGIDSYLAKPIDPDRLAAAVEGRPELEPASAELATSAAEEDEAPSVLGERVVFDLGEALSRARGKRPLLAELVRIFLEDAVVQMLALKAALDAADLERIERSAHRLKGSAMNVSAQLTADVAQQIEQRARAGQAPDACTLWEKLEAEVSRARKALGGFLAQNGGAGAAGGFGMAKGTAAPRVSSSSPISSVPFGSSFSP